MKLKQHKNAITTCMLVYCDATVQSLSHQAESHALKWSH